MTGIPQIKKDRFKYLNYLYEQSGGSLNSVYDMQELGSELGFDYSLMRNVVDYLINEGLISPHGLGGTIRLSHKGIKEIEQANENPRKSTEHFGPIITYNIHTIGEGNVVNTGDNNVFNLSQTLDRAAINAQIKKLEAILKNDILIDEYQLNNSLEILSLLLKQIQENTLTKETVGQLLQLGAKTQSVGSIVLSLFLLIYTP